MHTTDPNPLSLPRILCLHGGGVNATIFRLQLRSFLTNTSLTSRFRFVFAEAPFPCDAGPGIHPVYSDLGPFRRWVRWLPGQPEGENGMCRGEVLDAVREAMEGDGRAGGTGEWVAALGFSQGAKIAASLLYEMQIADDEGREGGVLVVDGEKVKWRFGVLLAGRAPIVALSELTEGLPWCQEAGGLADAADLDAISERPEMKLRVPTVHVHGLKDEGLALHRRLIDDYCAPLTTTLVEWDGTHRVPLKKNDVEMVVKAIVEVANEYGI